MRAKETIYIEKCVVVFFEEIIRKYLAENVSKCNHDCVAITRLMFSLLN
jgi:hypothetical protein